MQIPFYTSLRFRLIASVVIIEIIMLSIMVWNNVETIYRTHTDRLADTARSMVSQLANQAGDHLIEVDYAALEEQVLSIAKHAEVAYVVVLNDENVLVTKVGRVPHLNAELVDAHPTQVRDGVYDVTARINFAKRDLGKVHMGFSMSLTNQAIQISRNRSILIALVEIALSIVVTIFLGLGLTRSLQQLSKAAQMVEHGNFWVELPTDRQDEVGLTAHAFNSMVEAIEERTNRLEQRETHIRLLMDSTAEAVVGISEVSRCIFVNRACLEMLGYDCADDIVGQDFHEISHHSHPDGRPYPAEECTIRLGAKKFGSYHTDDEVFWRKDGTSFPVEAWTHPIEHEGKNTGYMLTFIDISVRKEAEKKLHQVSDQLHLLLQSSGEGIFGVDTELKCTFANGAACSLLGYPIDALIGQDMQQLVQHSTEEGFKISREMSPLFTTIRDNKPFRSDAVVMWSSDGTCFPVEYSCSPIIESGKITGAAVVFMDITESRAISRKIDYLATHDALTGLVNRHEFEVRLTNAMHELTEDNATHVLCYMDLDQFKVVNDTCGHIAGDELLRQLASVLKTEIRSEDTLARLGGDEFGVLLRSCPMEKGIELIENIRQTVSEFRFVWEDKTFSLGASVGVTQITPETSSIGSAMSEADAACYIAKDSGRNRIHVYKPDDANLAQRHGEMQWVSLINEALEQDRFVLYLQPIVPVGAYLDDMQKGTGKKFSHCEILLRMQDNMGREIQPGAFLPAAERYNLSPKVDRWVISRVFEHFSESRAQFDAMQMISINLSGNTLNDDEFLPFISELLERNDFPCEKVCFEITETAAVANLSKASQLIKILRSYGCKFALDDFGSGMSSFAYLKNLHVDYLKIDGNFIRDIVVDRVDRAMVVAVNQVGHVMGIKTIAEFVENMEIMQLLHEIGVDYAQGYGISKPKPVDEMLKLCAQSSGMPLKK